MVHTDSDPDDTAIYITDFTQNSDLPKITGTPWCRNLERRIVKVVLHDAQAEMADIVQIGSYYTIRKLRMVQSSSTKTFQGRLGGAERLIHKLQAKDTGNGRLMDLLQ